MQNRSMIYGIHEFHCASAESYDGNSNKHISRRIGPSLVNIPNELQISSGQQLMSIYIYVRAIKTFSPTSKYTLIACI